jgi:hypothetical protein
MTSRKAVLLFLRGIVALSGKIVLKNLPFIYPVSG